MLCKFVRMETALRMLAIKSREYVDHFLYVLCGKFLRSTQISINVTQKNQTKTNIFLTSRNGYKLLFSKAFNIK